MASTPINEKHIPVMLADCIEVLGAVLSSPGAVLVDGTLGLGGHSEAFLENFPELHLVAIDRDSNALAQAGERLARSKPDLLLLAPGPINRGVELTPEVADGPQSAILDQVTNGLAVRMAALYLVSGQGR